jgi:hypothetical protein
MNRSHNEPETYLSLGLKADTVWIHRSKHSAVVMEFIILVKARTNDQKQGEGVAMVGKEAD